MIFTPISSLHCLSSHPFSSHRSTPSSVTWVLSKYLPIINWFHSEFLSAEEILSYSSRHKLETLLPRGINDLQLCLLWVWNACSIYSSFSKFPSTWRGDMPGLQMPNLDIGFWLYNPNHDVRIFWTFISSFYYFHTSSPALHFDSSHRQVISSPIIA